MEDLFGHVPQKGDLFRQPMAISAPIPNTPGIIRAKMLAVLTEARAATTVPWDARELRAHTAMFPYWAEWLDQSEGEQLMLDFKTELDRLAAPTEQMGPNWQKLWGLAA